MSGISKGILAKCLDERGEEQDSSDRSATEVEKKPTNDLNDSSNAGVDAPLRRAEVVVDEVPPMHSEL